ncbi:MAG TPA: hypothetical protein VMV79_01445 [Alphaproteobacteria bacterium]|nr:hypothetical protein [Alphaproteobacteria bacterium]
MPSISNATASQQYFQVAQNPAKSGATTPEATNQTSSAAAQASTTVAAQPAVSAKAVQGTKGTAKGVYESPLHRNPDGSYGPRHTVQPPLSAQLNKVSEAPASSTATILNKLA